MGSGAEVTAESLSQFYRNKINPFSTHKSRYPTRNRTPINENYHNWKFLFRPAKRWWSEGHYGTSKCSFNEIRTIVWGLWVFRCRWMGRTNMTLNCTTFAFIVNTETVVDGSLKSRSADIIMQWSEPVGFSLIDSTCGVKQFAWLFIFTRNRNWLFSLNEIWAEPFARETRALSHR